MHIDFKGFCDLVVSSNHLNRPNRLHTCKIIYYKSGGGQVMIGSSVFRFFGGTFAVVAPDTVYQEVVTAQTEELICEVVAAGDVARLNSGLYYDNDNAVGKQFEKIRAEHSGGGQYRDVFLQLFSAELYFLLLRDSLRYLEKTNTMQDIIQYVDACFNEDLRIEELAKKAGYTCRHFRSLFAERTGVAPSEYILQKRIESARNLLLQTS